MDGFKHIMCDLTQLQNLEVTKIGMHVLYAQNCNKV